MVFKLLALLALALLTGTFGLRQPAVRVRGLGVRMSSEEGSSSSSSSSTSLWRERVEFVDLSSQAMPLSETARPLPLFLLGGAFFPEGVTVLNVFEMKYRTMMFDCANSDELFGYFMTDNTGRIASVGTLCKIVERRLLEDGRQLIQIQGVGRCHARKILKTLPYVLAEVEPEIHDEPPAKGEAEAIKLERETWDAVKYYMRLMRSYEPNKRMVVPMSMRRNRPTRANEADSLRRTKFSFALANMISMSQPAESQLLLQTTNVMKRLEAEKLILTQAAEGISEQLIGMEVITASVRDGIKFNSLARDDDEDILPEDILEEEVEEEKDPWDISNIE